MPRVESTPSNTAKAVEQAKKSPRPVPKKEEHDREKEIAQARERKAPVAVETRKGQNVNKHV